MKGGTKWNGREPTKRNLIEKTYIDLASFTLHTLYVHLRWRQTPLGLERALAAAATSWRARRLPTQVRCGHALACPRAAHSYSIV